MQIKAELLAEWSGGIFLRPHLPHLLLSPPGSPGDTPNEPSWQALGQLNPSLRPLRVCRWGDWVRLPLMEAVPSPLCPHFPGSPLSFLVKVKPLRRTGSGLGTQLPRGVLNESSP